jgi:hypothetical protein
MEAERKAPLAGRSGSAFWGAVDNQKRRMKHTKESDRLVLQRIKTLGDRSLSPEDHRDLERIIARLRERVSARRQDEQEDSAPNSELNNSPTCTNRTNE